MDYNQAKCNVKINKILHIFEVYKDRMYFIW